MDAQKIIKEYSEGKSLNQLAKENKVYPNNIKKILLENNIKVRTRKESVILENIKEQLLEIKSDINLPIDLLASRLKEVLNLILSITGEDYDFDMISEIFSRFCVGK